MLLYQLYHFEKQIRKKIAEKFKEVKNDNINLWSPSVVETSVTVKNQP